MLALPLVRQARYLGRYRQIAQVLGHHGFGYLLEQLGLNALLSLPRRLVLQLPPPAPVGVAERLCQALVELGPTFIKLGQLLSTRPDMLPHDLVVELNKLQDTVPPFPAEVAIAIIEAELGKPLAQLFQEFCPTPLAAASLGQAHTAILPTGEHVVVKVQRPDIAAIIATDLAIIADLAQLAQERTDLGAGNDLVELAWEFNTTLQAELDYRREAHNADRFRHMFAANQTIYIPKVYWEYTNTCVLTTERLYGVKINDLAGLAAAGMDQPRLARHSLQLILEEVFEHGFFHADPHPGNFFALPGEVIGAVDFGQVGVLDRETTQQLLLIVLGMANHDNGEVLRALQQMGMFARHEVTPALRRDLQRFTDRYVDRALKEVSVRETGEELIALAKRHRLRLPSPLAMLLKALVMTEGVGLQIDPNLDIFEIARPYAQKAFARQLTPEAVRERVAARGRSLAEAALTLPLQISDLLQQLQEGEFRIQTQEQELQRLAKALRKAANQLALALVLGAMILGLGMLSIAIGLGHWQGTIPSVLGLGGLLITLFIALLLAFGLMRSGDN